MRRKVHGQSRFWRYYNRKSRRGKVPRNWGYCTNPKKIKRKMRQMALVDYFSSYHRYDLTALRIKLLKKEKSFRKEWKQHELKRKSNRIGRGLKNWKKERRRRRNLGLPRD